MKTDRAYEWLVVCGLLCLVLLAVGYAYQPAIIEYFAPPDVPIDSAPSVKGFIPPAE